MTFIIPKGIFTKQPTFCQLQRPKRYMAMCLYQECLAYTLLSMINLTIFLKIDGVLTSNDNEDGLEGYELRLTPNAHDVVVEEYVVVPEREEGVRLTDAQTRLSAIITRMQAKLRINPGITLTTEEIAARDRKLKRKVVKRGAAKKIEVKVPWVPFAGLPTLVLPLDCFPENSPFNLKGVIDNSLGELTLNGYKLSPIKAWTVANVLRICGYDTKIAVESKVAGPRTFFSPNDVNMVWPLLHEPDYQEGIVTLMKQRARERHFIDLPPVTNSFLKGHRMHYAWHITARGVSGTPREREDDITEFGGALAMRAGVTVNYNASEAIARLRGFISRDKSDFRFVSSV
ncbi:hypothetical protein Droror1_Dr00015743 [Drosera rotundifolia]